ncbi:MAG: hypothetical protein ABIJ58_03540 [Nanoarchaeota archaeon]|nr:hypothetical protein [Pseudomonadota bacterium]
MNISEKEIFESLRKKLSRVGKLSEDLKTLNFQIHKILKKESDFWLDQAESLIRDKDIPLDKVLADFAKTKLSRKETIKAFRDFVVQKLSEGHGEPRAWEIFSDDTINFNTSTRKGILVAVLDLKKKEPLKALSFYVAHCCGLGFEVPQPNFEKLISEWIVKQMLCPAWLYYNDMQDATEDRIINYCKKKGMEKRIKKIMEIHFKKILKMEFSKLFMLPICSFFAFYQELSGKESKKILLPLLMSLTDRWLSNERRKILDERIVYKGADQIWYTFVGLRLDEEESFLTEKLLKMANVLAITKVGEDLTMEIYQGLKIEPPKFVLMAAIGERVERFSWNWDREAQLKFLKKTITLAQQAESDELVKVLSSLCK